jgi:hypothetical protein
MTEKEQKGMDRAKWFMGEPLNEAHMGYAIEMRTRPQTIGVAFNGMRTNLIVELRMRMEDADREQITPSGS